MDVGSNSVRLVFYRLDGRALWTVFNEKVLAGLGRDLATTGRLAPQGIDVALVALRRFRALIDASRPARVFAAATAAVRDASDGTAFCRRVEDETGFCLRVLSGAEEARFAAIGVLAGAPASQGLVGDLGGASLELTRLTEGAPGDGVTLPLGPFALGVSPFDADRVRRAAEREIGPIAIDYRCEILSAVGGAWRNLAMLHMRMSGYPLNIVHQYEMNRGEALSVSRFISQQSRGSLERIDGVSRRRLEGLPPAAVVLETLVEQLNIQKVVLSAYGLREGLLFDSMSDAQRAGDPLVEGCAALGARPSVAEALGGALETWLGSAFARLEPVFPERDSILVAAACRLAEFGAQLHPDHRADLVFEQVLRAPIAGMNHAERMFLACAAFGRHAPAAGAPNSGMVARLLDADRRQRARALGAAIRLGCDLSGRCPELLAHARLEIRPATIVLEAEGTWAPVLLGEQTIKRANTLAGLLGRELKTRIASEPAASRAREPAD